MGPRPALAHPDLVHQLELFGRVWTHWAFPHAYAGGLVAGLVVLALLTIALPMVRRSPAATYLVLVVLGHCVLTVYSASRLFLDVDPRTLFPVFAFALFLVARAMERVVHTLDGRAAIVARVAIGLYLLMWFSAPNAIINALVN